MGLISVADRRTAWRRMAGQVVDGDHVLVKPLAEIGLHSRGWGLNVHTSGGERAGRDRTCAIRAGVGDEIVLTRHGKTNERSR